MSDFPVITLHKKKTHSVQRFHPWIFSGAIFRKPEDLKEGEIVEIQDHKKNTLAMGHYQIGSIAVRIFAFEKVEPNYDFWKSKLEDALTLRKSAGLVRPDNNTYRLFFGEGDGLPGLVIDYYNGAAVIQCHNIGMWLMRETLTEILKDIYGSELHTVYDKSAESLPKKADIDAENGWLYGDTESVVVLENGNKFKIDWVTGQKTGFFIDQRENRRLLAEFAPGKKVLNTFCYSGGFSVYALNAGAEQVDSIDISGKAIDLTKENIELNEPKTDNWEAIKSDTFDYLKDKEGQYDIIILDPPAFAKHKDVRHRAVLGYKRLNEMAFRTIKKGGILFTFSCTQVVDKELFYNTIRAAAIEAGRKVRILQNLSQPADHPVNIYHPEGEYIKGQVLYVE